MADPQVIRLSTSGAPVSSSNMTSQGKIAAALMRAGITNPAAWAAAGVTDSVDTVEPALATVPATVLENFDAYPAVTLKKGTNDPTFFISWRSQKQIVKTLGWKSAAMIWGGPTLTLLCVYILASHLAWI